MSAAAGSVRMMKTLSERYSGITASPDEKIMEAMMSTFDHAGVSGSTYNDVMLTHVLMMIHRFFGFKKVAIATRVKDGRFMHSKVTGFVGEEEAMKKALLTLDEIKQVQMEAAYRFNSNIYIVLSGSPAKPAAGSDAHRTPSDSMVEGDSIFVFMLGKKKEIIGWIQLASTRDGKFPTSKTLHWLSLIADMIASLTSAEKT